MNKLHFAQIDLFYLYLAVYPSQLFLRKFSRGCEPFLSIFSCILIKIVVLFLDYKDLAPNNELDKSFNHDIGNLIQNKKAVFNLIFNDDFSSVSSNLSLFFLPEVKIVMKINH